MLTFVVTTLKQAPSSPGPVQCRCWKTHSHWHTNGWV